MTITYGELIRQRRLDLGMTQKELADAACVSRQYISDLEHNNTGYREMVNFKATLYALGLEIRIVEVDNGRLD